MIRLRSGKNGLQRRRARHELAQHERPHAPPDARAPCVRVDTSRRRRIRAPQSSSRDWRHGRRERAAMRRRVDAARQPADDRHPAASPGRRRAARQRPAHTGEAARDPTMATAGFASASTCPRSQSTGGGSTIAASGGRIAGIVPRQHIQLRGPLRARSPPPRERAARPPQAAGLRAPPHRRSSTRPGASPARSASAACRQDDVGSRESAMKSTRWATAGLPLDARRQPQDPERQKGRDRCTHGRAGPDLPH